MTTPSPHHRNRQGMGFEIAHGGNLAYVSSISIIETAIAIINSAAGHTN